MLQHIFNSVDISSCRQQPAGVYEKQPEIKIFSVFHSFFINLIEKHCCTLFEMKCSKRIAVLQNWVMHYKFWLGVSLLLLQGQHFKILFFLRQILLQKIMLKAFYLWKGIFIAKMLCYVIWAFNARFGNKFILSKSVWDTYLTEKMSFRSKIHLARK